MMLPAAALWMLSTSREGPVAEVSSTGLAERDSDRQAGRTCLQLKEISGVVRVKTQDEGEGSLCCSPLLLPWFLVLLVFMYFFCLARQFWNQTCVTRLLSPVIWAILSRSCPSGFESIWKLACKIWICSSVNVVRIRFVFFFDWASEDSPLSAFKNRA